MTEIDADEAARIATEIREHLRTIRRHWAATADPMMLGDGGRSGGSRLPSSTIVLRADVVLSLAFWVHALLDEWPAVLDHLSEGEDGTLTTWTETLDCTDVIAMAFLLDNEADRIAGWATFGPTCAEDLRPLAAAVRSVARPPLRDTVTIGDCPQCHEPVKVRLTSRVPQPSTDPEHYAPWTTVPSGTLPPSVIRHTCGYALTLEQWHTKLIGTQRPLLAVDVVREVHKRLGLRYSPLTVRTWARRGLVGTRGQSHAGESLYDLHEVLRYLVRRDDTREQMQRGA